MDSSLRSLSLPSLHQIQKKAGKAIDRINCGEGLPLLPSTPSTAASSRSTIVSSISTARDDSAALYKHRSLELCSSGVELPAQRATGRPCGTLVSQQPSPGNSEDGTCASLHDRRHSQVPRPDEELLQCIRTNVVLGQGESVELIYDLIQRGEDINQRSERGFTPLLMAAAANSAPLIALLLEKRADVSLASVGRAELPLHYAACVGHEVICHLLVPPNREARLLDAANAVGWTPLHMAASAGYGSIVETLLRSNATPCVKNNVICGYTALHLATSGGHASVLESLLEREANANLADTLNRTSLHLAAVHADATCVSILLRNRADPLLKGGEQNITPLRLVPLQSRNGNPERSRQLLSAYSRDAPEPLRSDARFDLPGGHDILSAYTKPVSWGTRKRAKLPDSMPSLPEHCLKFQNHEQEQSASRSQRMLKHIEYSPSIGKIHAVDAGHQADHEHEPKETLANGLSQSKNMCNGCDASKPIPLEHDLFAVELCISQEPSVGQPSDSNAEDVDDIWL